MVDAVRNAFKKGLPSLEWMDEKTRKAADDKVSSCSWSNLTLKSDHHLISPHSRTPESSSNKVQTLEMSALKLFTMANLHYQLS